MFEYINMLWYTYLWYMFGIQFIVFSSLGRSTIVIRLSRNVRGLNDLGLATKIKQGTSWFLSDANKSYVHI